MKEREREKGRENGIFSDSVTFLSSLLVASPICIFTFIFLFLRFKLPYVLLSYSI